ncbi:MAG: glycosyltransferase family 4 protein [Planctomycetaceae bacterium]|nr:glycosyltransferase family 4 protein [Planctomycetaceae bacterium]
MKTSPPKSSSHRHAVCLTGARSLNKRMSLFVEGLLDTGLGVQVVALPRGNWNLQRFETRAEQQPALSASCVCFSVTPDSHLSVVLCFHWIMLPLAVLWATIRRVPLIYDEHDHYEINTLEGGGPLIVRQFRRLIVRGIHRICLPFVTLVTCIHMANAELKQHLQRWQKNVLELHNYPVTAWRSVTAVTEATRPLSFIYVGGVFEEKGVRHAAEAFLSLPPEVRGTSHLHIFGGGDESLIRELQECPSVTVHNSVTPQRLREFAEQERCCGLVLYNDHPRYGRIGTNSRKLYEYLAMGMPVIATSVGEIKQFVADHDVGIVIDARVSTRELQQAMLRLADGTARTWERQAGNARLLMQSPEMTWEHEWAKVLRSEALSRGVRAA